MCPHADFLYKGCLGHDRQHSKEITSSQENVIFKVELNSVEIGCAIVFYSDAELFIV